MFKFTRPYCTVHLCNECIGEMHAVANEKIAGRS
jgi:hypothetical protein